jgi:hypothetical protein
MRDAFFAVGYTSGEDLRVAYYFRRACSAMRIYRRYSCSNIVLPCLWYLWSNPWRYSEFFKALGENGIYKNIHLVLESAFGGTSLDYSSLVQHR